MFLILGCDFEYWLVKCWFEIYIKESLFINLIILRFISFKYIRNGFGFNIFWFFN